MRFLKDKKKTTYMAKILMTKIYVEEEHNNRRVGMVEEWIELCDYHLVCNHKFDDTVDIVIPLPASQDLYKRLMQNSKLLIMVFIS